MPSYIFKFFLCQAEIIYVLWFFTYSMLKVEKSFINKVEYKAQHILQYESN
jgi:hypothetical protein